MVPDAPPILDTAVSVKKELQEDEGPAEDRGLVVHRDGMQREVAKAPRATEARKAGHRQSPQTTAIRRPASKSPIISYLSSSAKV